jgi:hypothetical protein
MCPHIRLYRIDIAPLLDDERGVATATAACYRGPMSRCTGGTMACSTGARPCNTILMQLTIAQDRNAPTGCILGHSRSQSPDV